METPGHTLRSVSPSTLRHNLTASRAASETKTRQTPKPQPEALQTYVSGPTGPADLQLVIDYVNAPFESPEIDALMKALAPVMTTKK